MTDTERNLIKAVIENPDDKLPRLVLCDYWEETGRDEHAQECRRQINTDELDRKPIPTRNLPPQTIEEYLWGGMLDVVVADFDMFCRFGHNWGGESTARRFVLADLAGVVTLRIVPPGDSVGTRESASPTPPVVCEARLWLPALTAVRRVEPPLRASHDDNALAMELAFGGPTELVVRIAYEHRILAAGRTGSEARSEAAAFMGVWISEGGKFEGTPAEVWQVRAMLVHDDYRAGIRYVARELPSVARMSSHGPRVTREMLRDIAPLPDRFVSEYQNTWSEPPERGTPRG